jgi:hypothetical protein
MFFAATQYIPPYYDAFQFNDFIRQEVKFAVSSRKSTDDIRNSVVQKAKELNIPITQRDIKITRRGPAFTLDLEYHFPIDLRVYQHDLVFHANESGEVFDQ